MSSVILVTGGNQGLGYTLIKALAAHSPDYKIILAARRREAGEKAVSDLHADGHKNVQFLLLDITDDASIVDAVDYVSKKYGKVDDLVLNAAIAQGTGTLRQQYNTIFDTNVSSNAAILEKIEPVLKKSVHPRVFLLSSGLSSFGFTLQSIEQGLNASDFFGILPYTVSKSALNMVAVYYSQLWKNSIRVLAIDPGHTATAMNNYAGPQTPEQGIKAAFTAITTDKFTSGSLVYQGAEDTQLVPHPW